MFGICRDLYKYSAQVKTLYLASPALNNSSSKKPAVHPMWVQRVEEELEAGVCCRSVPRLAFLACAPRTTHTYHQEVIGVPRQCSVQHMRTWKLHGSCMCSWQSPLLFVFQFWLQFNLSWFLLSKSIGLFPLYLSTSTCLSLARVETGLSMKPNTHQKSANR